MKKFSLHKLFVIKPIISNNQKVIKKSAQFTLSAQPKDLDSRSKQFILITHPKNWTQNFKPVEKMPKKSTLLKEQ